ncbi:hypothetical protein [Dolichospermum phage Dfl-JY23]
MFTVNSTPLDHLRSFPKPKFNVNSTLLLPLGQSNCGVAPDIHKELAEYWGYGLLIDRRGLASVAASNPGKYTAIANIASLYSVFENWRGDKPGLPVLPDGTWIKNSSGVIVLENGRPIISPTAPDQTFEIVGDYIGDQLKSYQDTAGQPIKLLLNEGEYGLWLLQDRPSSSGHWGQDPVATAGFNASGLPFWTDFVSQQKARQESIIKNRIYAKLGQTPVYSWYQEQYGTERGRWSDWKRYIFIYDYFLNNGFPVVSNYTAPEMYFGLNNSGFSGINYNSAVNWDMLTQALNNISGAISLGQDFTYPWISLGWEAPGQAIADPERFMGMIKMYYTAGAIGSVAGYFVCEGSSWSALYNNTAVGVDTPLAIKQYVIQGHAHALFSHLEEYLINGDLLPGVGNSSYTAFTNTVPSREFPVIGESQQVQGLGKMVTVPTARVIARKINNQDRWLVCAWANTGENRDIQVNIDSRLGTLTLRARKAGSVYKVSIVDGKIYVNLVDCDAMNPTTHF